MLDALALITSHADARLTYYPADETVPTHTQLHGDRTTLVFKDAGRRPRQSRRSTPGESDIDRAQMNLSGIAGGR
ncbi:MAG: hypothetical protein WAM30_13355 [Candidatus Dormiibacterota bacterium]